MKITTLKLDIVSFIAVMFMMYGAFGSQAYGTLHYKTFAVIGIIIGYTAFIWKMVLERKNRRAARAGTIEYDSNRKHKEI